jgi:uncharacterized SAM-binding protein YcdF (DUF218 family)
MMAYESSSWRKSLFTLAIIFAIVIIISLIIMGSFFIYMQPAQQQTKIFEA